MRYLSVREIADKWQISQRRVHELCSEKRIEGVTRLGRAWMIPATAEKPSDPRTISVNRPSSLLPGILLTSYSPLKSNEAYSSQGMLNLDAYQAQFELELTYLRGNMEPVFADFPSIDLKSPTCLAQLVITAAAAISIGKFDLLLQIEQTLSQLKLLRNGNVRELTLIELAQATLGVSIGVPELCPKWLTDGSLSHLPQTAKPFALYVYTKYLLTVDDIPNMLAVAKTALILSESDSFTLTDIYLHLMCAVALTQMDRIPAAEGHLESALNMAMPNHLIMPIIEHVVCLNGLLEKVLAKNYPTASKEILVLWHMMRQNWITVHNHLSDHFITPELTLRQYQVASLAKRGCTNIQIAQQLGISTGCVKSYLQATYEKLHISSRKDLSLFIP